MGDYPKMRHLTESKPQKT